MFPMIPMPENDYDRTHDRTKDNSKHFKNVLDTSPRYILPFAHLLNTGTPAPAPVSIAVFLRPTSRKECRDG